MPTSTSFSRDGPAHSSRLKPPPTAAPRTAQSANSAFASSSTFTSLNVTTRTDFTKRADR